jgi:hypothetical protein
MKILLVGSKHNSSIENMYFDAFKSLKKKINFLNFKSFIELNLIEKIIYKLFPKFFLFINFKKLKKKLKYENYTHIILFNSGNLNFNYLNNLKKNNTKIYFINILSDNPFWNLNNQNKKNIKKVLTLFDKVFSWSKDIIKIYKKKNIEYLPFAFSDKYKIFYKKKIIEKTLFFGSWDKERESIISKINPKFIDIYGNSWTKAGLEFKKKYNINYTELVGNELVKKIQKYLICLNLMRPQVRNSHNMRLFEILGNGGILLSKFTEEHNKLLKNQSGCVFYTSTSMINKKIQLIILNKEKFIRLKSKNKKLYKNQSYLSRTKTILDKIK